MSEGAKKHQLNEKGERMIRMGTKTPHDRYWHAGCTYCNHNHCSAFVIPGGYDINKATKVGIKGIYQSPSKSSSFRSIHHNQHRKCVMAWHGMFQVFCEGSQPHIMELNGPWSRPLSFDCTWVDVVVMCISLIDDLRVMISIS